MSDDAPITLDEEAVMGCLSIGVHPSEMITAMERKVADLKDMLAQLPG